MYTVKLCLVCLLYMQHVCVVLQAVVWFLFPGYFQIVVLFLSIVFLHSLLLQDQFETDTTVFVHCL